MRLTEMLPTKTFKRSALTFVVAAGLLSGAGAGVARADSPGVPNLDWVAVGDTNATVVWTNTADEGQYLVRFQLSYQVGGDGNPTVIGGPVDPTNDLADKADPLPDDVDYNQQGTYEVTGLRPATQYCFSMRSYTYYGNPLDAFTGDEPTPTFSPWSAQMCDTTTLTLSLQNVHVTATREQYTYAFDVAPDDGSANEHYTGTYTPGSQTAHEDYGKAHWDFICPADPWTSPGDIVCTQPDSLAGSSLVEPAGAKRLGEVTGGHATLEAAFKKALAAVPVYEPSQQILPSADVVPPTPGPKPAAQILPAEVTLPKADLDAVSITGASTVQNGTNAVYTATIRNNGAAATGNVELQINVTNDLLASGSVVQTIGLSCAQSFGGAIVTCQGGSLASRQQTTLQFTIHAANVGQGTISLALNPNRTIDETDLSNNGVSYTVTVTK